MGKVTEGIKRLFKRRKPVPREEAEDVADWVNEGGAFHPDGPPAVKEPRDTKQ